MTDRQLVAHRIADTVADPIPRSLARVTPTAARRLGYAFVGICRHCTDAVTSSRDSGWVHRGHGTPSCLLSRSRNGGLVPR